MLKLEDFKTCLLNSNVMDISKFIGGAKIAVIQTMSDGSTRYSYDDGNQEICTDDNDSDQTWCNC